MDRKSGANLRLNLVGEVYDSMQCGTRTVNTAQVPLTTDSIVCWQVIVQASRTNTQYLRIGNSKQGCYFELAAGQAITIPINNLNKVYVRSESGTQTVSWIAML